MKRNKQKRGRTVAGIESRGRSRGDFDKSKPDKRLKKRVGKPQSPHGASLAVTNLPAILSRTPQLPAATRLAIRNAGGVQYLPLSQLLAAPRVHEEGSFTKGPFMQNEFRIAFEQLPPIGTLDGSLRAAVLPRLDLLTRALFLEALSLDLTSVASMIVPPAGSRPIDSAFFHSYHSLVDGGRILVAATGHAGAGNTPHAFDLRHDAPFARRPTLATLLRAYQLSDASEDSKRAALVATRILLGLERYSSADKVLVAAERVPCDAFHGLPDRFAAGIPLDSQLAKKTIQNSVSALRAALQFGVRHDLFPLFFPKHRRIDAWTELLDRTFPLGRSGKAAIDVKGTRSGLSALFHVARVDLNIDSPSELTPALVKECHRLLGAAHRAHERAHVSSLQHLLFEGAGNWADPVIHMIATTLRAVRKVTALPYLVAPGETPVATATLEGCCHLLEQYGFDASWKSFFAWYQDYSLLEFRQLRARQAEFPSRPEARKLKPDAFEARLVAVRAYLGLAKQAFPDSFIDLGPSDVFGTHFELLTTMMIDAWELSASTDGGVSHRSSGGLRSIITAGGLIAQALLERSLHERRPARCAAPPRDKHDALNASQERIAEDRTAMERALNESYIESRRICDSMLAECRKDANGSAKNTVKNLQDLIEATPFEHFCAAQEELLRRVHQAMESGHETARATRKLIVATLIHGLLVSGGSRRSEFAHLREGTQTNLQSGVRAVKLRAADRKNDTAHNYVARAKWLPDWFLDLYFETVRPAIASRRATPEGPNPFVILNPTSGRPYGCEEERSDGSGRNTRAFANRKTRMANLWTRHVADAFVSLKFLVPIGPHRFTMHVVRNVGGHWVFQQHGLTAAANFLGDSPKSVLNTYAVLDGAAVDTTI